MKYYNKNLVNFNFIYHHLNCGDFKEKEFKHKLSKIIAAIRDDDFDDEDKKILFDYNATKESIWCHIEHKKSLYDEFLRIKNNETKKVTDKIHCNIFEAFEEYFEVSEDSEFIENGNEAELVYVDSFSIKKSIVFLDFKADEDFDTQFSEWYELKEEDGKYVFETACCLDNKLHKLSFESCYVKTEICSSEYSSILDSPWLYVISLYRELFLKAKYAFDLLNEKEKSLLPFAREFWNITIAESVTEAKQVNLDNFIKTATDLGYKINKDKLYNFNSLNDAKYENLWRYIYNLIIDSQEGHSSKSVVTVQMLGNRKKITDILHEAGYKGEYPDFYKNGSIVKPVTIESYGIDYTLSFEKNVRFYIKCLETSNGDGQISFICGFVCLKKDQIDYITDVFSTMFANKGKRYFKVFHYSEFDFISDKKPDITEFARVAVKKAQGEKLTKKQRENFYFAGEKNNSYNVLMFAFFAVFFGLFWSLGMFLFVCFDEMSATVSFVQAAKNTFDVYWIVIGAAAGILFASGMMIVKLFTGKK